MKLRHLDLFSGIGGFSLGLERTGGFETVAFCEIDTYCQKVLKKNFPGVPIFEDVRNLDATGLGRIDIITGGYPCQPFSTAGKREGDQDDRHLWPAMFEVIKSIRPTWVIGENVAGHVSMGLDNVLSDMEGEGYTCRPYIIPACAVDAKHRRDRIWIVAHANGTRGWNGTQNRCISDVAFSANQGLPQRRSNRQCSGEAQNESGMVSEPQRRGAVANTTELQRNGGEYNARKSDGQESKSGNCSGKSVLANSSSTGRKEQHTTTIADRQGYGAGCNDQVWGNSRWPAEPGVGRVANGIPKKLDRLKGLGNAVVPQIPELLGHAILASIQQEATHKEGRYEVTQL
ncbi:MAG: DNA cytosine methyltransferase [Desulfobacteraceae bacterium]|nr:DNA cytosine methyltransferase [Desulfobacteraceae bacterium]